MKKYVEENKKYPIQKDKKEISNLCQWRYEQMAIYRGSRKDRKILNNEQIKFLESIPGWTWGKGKKNIQNKWYINLEELKLYVNKYKKIPSSKTKLGEWCNTQRKIYRGTKKGKLNKEQIKLLESIPDWYWNR